MVMVCPSKYERGVFPQFMQGNVLFYWSLVMLSWPSKSVSWSEMWQAEGVLHCFTYSRTLTGCTTTTTNEWTSSNYIMVQVESTEDSLLKPIRVTKKKGHLCDTGKGKALLWRRASLTNRAIKINPWISALILSARVTTIDDRLEPKA